MKPFVVPSVGIIRLDLRRHIHRAERGVDDLLIGTHQILFFDQAINSTLSKDITQLKCYTYIRWREKCWKQMG